MAGQTREAYLLGKIVPGIFQQERGFIITVGDRDVALYADSGDVLDERGIESTTQPREEVPGKLRVLALSQEGEHVLVLLRQEAGTGERTLLVKPNQLEYVT